jgi:uncharacterized coiled-coil DUF342 family protein
MEMKDRIKGLNVSIKECEDGIEEFREEIRNCKKKLRSLKLINKRLDAIDETETKEKIDEDARELNETLELL